MNGKTHQFEALQRIAAYAAKVRGHELAVWRTGANSSTARCAKCGRAVTVYASLLQPDMDGPALASRCGETAAEEAAA
jgi:hypothetical protein